VTNLKRNVAIVASAAVIAALGLGGVMSANADTGTTPSNTTVGESGQGEGQDASDGPNVGPDTNANEPGHQDASDAGDATE